MMAAKPTKTPVMVVQELSVKKNLPPPIYDLIVNNMGTHQNRFDYQVTLDGIQAIGTGTSKQISKHNAAHNLLMKLKELNRYNPEEDPVQEFTRDVKNAKVAEHTRENLVPSLGLNFIGPLKDFCLQQKIHDPEFTLISEVGPPHNKEFTFECKLGSIITRATAATKKMAKQLAAKDMFDRLKEVLPTILEEYNRSQEEHQKCITSTSTQVLNKFNQLYGGTVFNKTVKVEEYPMTLLNLMVEREKNIADFEKDLEERSEESLKRILDALDVKLVPLVLQEEPFIVSLSVTIDTPLTVIGIGDTLEKARVKAIQDLFTIIDYFMRL
ncbi:unnamed protein product [Acanthoscelides obtectus]|uniref:DRBM domain-containing protein n=1 Tax=Acanthoscelides obtectus TaxID=200917 RepID=A0A9P0PH66_ACAOB|nr:unnamed protein product [Acanthoscelides obtectus]CAK1670246.1 Interferon-inducible double-stranded RNA-dependent protein kinase activator A [Acanthoscelides obtectus]